MSLFLTFLLGISMAATLGVLVFGLVGLARGGGDPVRSNRLMRYRVLFQAAALLIVMLLLSLMKS